ncbi:DUF2339 domain-containing protein [Desulfosporosinus sp. BICA1-9]|uniref:DUF2339 domain-containing protein n=1 Tax=Desulfosporosinus sp. BICA1-9 TaxID=1531958 RepID=UPI00054B169B|nr:DUF2339 domain-containing protein [Desulfosporosinus sp. BICA1-9]KJS47550.1 MAG: hypothetical protein VR66_19105 [Peptococcaceae bacterium BRH_c23]KJS89233.1 MAG: hypothetical protein JL57_08295 [Desulfosporosinus sp. BICA1-9]
MSKQDDLQQLLEKYYDFTNDFDKVIANYKTDEVLAYNKELLSELEKSKRLISELQTNIQKLTQENSQLKTSLSELILDEKLQILKLSKQKIDNYFLSSELKGQNLLRALEQTALGKINDIFKETETVLELNKREVLQEITALQVKVKNAVKNQSTLFSSNTSQLKESVAASYTDLAQETVSEEVFQKRLRNNNFELKFGLNWLNWIGAFLILLGIMTFAKYSYSHWLGGYAKGVSIFLISSLFLVIGEFLMRKAYNQFAKGVISIGVGGLYSSILISYFVLEIITPPVALGLSFLVSMASVLLVQRYRSRTISVFALLGGYLPVFLYHFTVSDIGDLSSLLLVAYVLMLNSSIMATSTFKKWNSVKYFSFISGMLFFLATLEFSQNVYINIFYSFAIFLMYTTMFLLNPLKANFGKLIPADILVLGINTLLTSIITYLLFAGDPLLKDYKGILSLAFCAIYFVLAKGVEKKIPKHDANTVWLFYISSLTFSFLIIPFQFGYVWLSLGWVTESLILILFALKIKSNLLERMGWIAYLLAYCNFFIKPFFYQQYYHITYLLMVASSVFLLYSYFVTGRHRNYLFTWKYTFLDIFKYLALARVLIYIIDELRYLFENYLQQIYNETFYHAVVFFLAIYLYIKVLQKTSWLHDKVILWAVTGLSVGFAGGIILMNAVTRVFNLTHPNLLLEILSLIVLVGLNGLAFMSLKESVLRVLALVKLNLEIYPVVLAGYLLITSSCFLTGQFYWVRYINFALNVMYMGYAFAFIRYGFNRNYVLIRRAGLGLALLVCVKLFLVDLAGLDTLGRIISFFGIGAIALLISYAYQKMSKIQAVTYDA